VSGELVLVTGGSGFIGAHCILRLLADGYRVRTTVRSLARETEVREMLATGGAGPDIDLGFFEADLLSDAGWREAVDGCDFVLHVASPFPLQQPKRESDLIVPACGGTLRVLRAARDAKVSRVVLTSSFAAIGYGHPPADRRFTEADWTDPDGPGVTAYVKSKVLAEQAAWDLIAAEGSGLELSAVNPVAVLGPLLGPDFSTSVEMVAALMHGRAPALPRVTFNLVDVRDVADLHLRAMTDPAASGERFLAVADGPIAFVEVARVLKARMGEHARRVPSRQVPDWAMRVAAAFVADAKQVVPELGVTRSASNEKARRILGWEPRSNEDAIVATAESLVQLGLVD
jgi:nucleoside-diphosphate-sugar epimerase